MVEYLSGGRVQGSSTATSSPPQTSWKELGRSTLSSASDTISVSSFTAKDNLLVLLHNIKNGNCVPLLQFNSDTGSNYSRRYAGNGTEGSPNVSQTGIEFQWTGVTPTSYIPIHITNIANQEKLVIGHSVEEKTAGAGTAPDRMEVVGKWANTSNQITTISFDHNSTGNFASGTELIVLGCDNDEADSGTNFWQELTVKEATSAVTGTWETDTFTAKKYLWIRSYFTGATTDPQFRCGNGSIDTGSNYADRYQYNGAADGTSTSASMAQVGSTYTGTGFNDMFIINKSDEEKLIINHNNRADSAGASNDVKRLEGTAKWTNTSAQINKIGYYRSSGTIADSGSWIKVYGAD